MPVSSKIRQALRGLVKSIIPTEIYDRPARSAEPPALAHTMDAATVHGILREAEAGDTRRLFAVYRDVVLADTHLQTEFSKRKLALLGDAMNVSALDPDDPEDVAASDFVRETFEDLSGKREALSHLLDATLFPVSVVEKKYRAGGTGRYALCDLSPVPYHLLDFSAEGGGMRIRDLDPISRQPLGTFHEVHPSRYIVHRGHLLTSFPDRWGGPMRAALFWWLFKTQDRAWWARFLERFGAPFIVGHYNSADTKSRRLLETSFSEATRIFGLVIPTDARIELMQTNATQGGDAFEAFHRVANAELSKLVVGQTMTTEASAGGIGGTQAQVHEQVRADIRDFDAAALAETLRDQLFRQIVTINGLPGRAPVISWGTIDSGVAEVSGAFLQGLTQGGLELTDEGIDTLSQRVGLPLRRAAAAALPRPGETVAAFAADTLFDSDRPEVDTIAANAAVAVAAELRKASASTLRAIRNSTDPDDLRRRLLALHSDLDPAPLAALIAAALSAQSANALARL